MKQLSPLRAILYHLYPGIAITILFIVVTPSLTARGYPPQLGILLSIILVALPILGLHLLAAKRKEDRQTVADLNGLTAKLPAAKLFGYVLLSVVIAFILWGVTQPASTWISSKLFAWLPDWYTIQDFKGFDHNKIKTVLVLNLALNGVAAPFLEELYFRGYLLPRMTVFGRWSFLVSTVLFSLYHFWQPYIYFTLIVSLLPMIYFTWKTRDLRIALYSHCLLNLIGALASFGLALHQG